MRVSWLSQCNRMSHAFFERDASVVRKPPVPSPSFLTIASHIATNLNISDEPFVLTLRTNAWTNTVVLDFVYLFIFSLILSHCRDICALYHFRRRPRLLRSRALDLSLQSSPPVHLLPCGAHRSHQSSHFVVPPWRNCF